MQPGTFKKIYNWFRHLFKTETRGSKEARQLEQVRYNLEKGLAKINENKVADTNVGESGKGINVSTKENVEKSRKIEYNKSAEREDFTDALSKEQWHRFYESVDKHGIEQKQEGAINTVIVDDKIIRSKYDREKPNIFDVYKISEGVDELSKKFDITTSDILQDIYEIAEEENVDERKIKRSLEKYFKEGLLGRYDSNSNVFVDKNTNTRENIERNNSNIGKESRGREDLSRTKQNRSIDDTSFSLSENEIQVLEDYSRDEIKQIATDYIKTTFLYSDVNTTIKNMR